MSAGGNTCGDTTNEACDPDECYDRDECPGYGYWCKDAGIAKVTSLLDIPNFFSGNGFELIIIYSTISAIKTCYCEFDDQDADLNGIMCNTTDGESRIFGSCDAGQPCIGNETENYASRKSELCREKNIS